MKKNSEKIYARVLGLKKLSDYQEGTVVSRTLVQKKVGTMTIFAFDQGTLLSEHTAPFDAVVQVVEGRGKITVSGKSFFLKEGEMIIMPAGEPHALKATKRFKMLLTMIKG